MIKGFYWVTSGGQWFGLIVRQMDDENLHC